MEKDTILTEILTALKSHSEHIDKRFDEVDKRFDEEDKSKRFDEVDKRFDEVDKRFDEVDKRFDEVDSRLDRLEMKQDGSRIELTGAQETINFLANKVNQHDRKIRELLNRQSTQNPLFSLNYYLTPTTVWQDDDSKRAP